MPNPDKERERDQAYGYLSRLFTAWAPQCEPLPDLLGLCTQLDNYGTGLRAYTDRMGAALMSIADDYGHGWLAGGESRRDGVRLVKVEADHHHRDESRTEWNRDSPMTRNYDSTVARIAGNILSGFVKDIQTQEEMQRSVRNAVALARLIIQETRETEPEAQEKTP